MDEKELTQIWTKILVNLRENIAESACDRWLSPMKATALDETHLFLEAPNEFSLNYIQDRYIPFIKDAVREVVGREIAIRLTSAKSDATYQDVLTENNGQTVLMVAESPPKIPYGSSASAKDPSSLSPIAPGDHSSLNPQYTFDKFVIGNSNRFAHAAALAVSESPGSVYNPLFMYGGVGLGKTHLMQAIGNQILQSHPEMRVLYISSEKFTNEFINSIVKGNPEAFRQKYRTIDVLLVDDIQFLYKKEQTQEEFFHTFNTLFDARKAIILSSDRHPRNIQTLEDRLRSRFEWGLITDVQAPDLETRIAILKKKAIIEDLDVPNDVLTYIASRIDNNIRELEGALTRVVAYAQLNRRPITTDLVSEAMKDVYPTQRTAIITLELIQKLICSHFNITNEDMMSKKRTKEIAFARQVAMYLCRELTDSSLPQIGEYFGGRDHTTVLHAYKTIEEAQKNDHKLNASLQELKHRLSQM